MPDYSKSKILLLGANGVKVNEANSFILPTTIGRAEFLADIKRKYRDYVIGKGKEQPYYSRIDSIGIENLTAVIITEQSCKDKNELNEFLKRTVDLFNNPVEKVIEINKKEIKEITIKRYTDTIRLLQKRINDPSTLFYNNSKLIIAWINTELKSNENKKNYLKALVAVIPVENLVRKIYQAELARLGELQQGIRDKQEKTHKQEENWIDYGEVITKYNELYSIYDKNKKVSVDLIVASFYSGIYFATWRVKELLYLKFRNYDKDKENYIDFQNKQFVLHIYKTEKEYGERRQKIPNAFMKLIKIFITGLKGDYLIENEKGEQSNYYELNNIIKRVYTVSASLLRNIYVTNLFNSGKLTTNSKIKAVALEMRNNPIQTLEYVKFNPSAVEQDTDYTF